MFYFMTTFNTKKSFKSLKNTLTYINTFNKIASNFHNSNLKAIYLTLALKFTLH